MPTPRQIASLIHNSIPTSLFTSEIFGTGEDPGFRKGGVLVYRAWFSSSRSTSAMYACVNSELDMRINSYHTDYLKNWCKSKARQDFLRFSSLCSNSSSSVLQRTYVVYSTPVYTSRIEPRSDVIDRRNAEIVGRLPFDRVSFSPYSANSMSFSVAWDYLVRTTLVPWEHPSFSRLIPMTYIITPFNASAFEHYKCFII